jgi:hypothetical protein
MPTAIDIDVSIANRPRRLELAISAEYTAGGALVSPVVIPLKKKKK